MCDQRFERIESDALLKDGRFEKTCEHIGAAHYLPAAGEKIAKENQYSFLDDINL
jgi:hypothetical protein